MVRKWRFFASCIYSEQRFLRITYMRQLQTVKDRVVALKQRDGLLTSNDQQAADVLANYT